jgi:hypothetical protein
MVQEAYRVGDLVTVLPPYDSDPYILNFQHYGRIAEVAESQAAENQASTYYMVELDATLPPRRQVGPFPSSRLAKGWRDQSGRWLVE